MAALPRLAGLSLRKLLLLTWRGTISHNIANRSAELAFWFLLGFFPMLLSATSIVSMIGSAPGSQGSLMKFVGEALPSVASELVRKILEQTTGGGRTWFSLLFALWASSSATAGLMSTLNGIHDIKENRPWWKSRLIAVLLALVVGVALTTGLIVVVYGPEILRRVLPGPSTFYVGRIAQWPAAALLLILALLGVYRFAPSVEKPEWRWLVPGSVVATGMWIAISAVFKLYVRHLADFGLLYGSLGTLVILMFWFYLSGVAILVGGEINAILEEANAKQEALPERKSSH
jgi:membrane protein